MDPRVVIHRPDDEGGRRVHIDGTILGLARSEGDLREFLRRVELPGWEDVDLTDSSLFKWEGPGPESWEN
ncbi:hypothetical protein [Streptomyces sp. IMTB 1903]|uniref:hypothetical protein n=1 Tax=Streptomyces sp. IMTB 1903 TaxID=1776680 RepID=UPI00075906B1|nr:hypothetical protein [Streptomyces sp. IMTB 1903]